MAKPAASSAAFVMRRPVDNLRKLALRARVVFSRFRWALMDEIFVLTLRPILGSDPSLSLFRVEWGDTPWETSETWFDFKRPMRRTH